MTTELHRINTELKGIAAKLLELGLPWQPGMLTSDGKRLIAIESEYDDEHCWYATMWGERPDMDGCPLSKLNPPDLFDDITYAYVEMWMRQRGLESMGVTNPPTRLEEAKQILHLMQALVEEEQE